MEFDATYVAAQIGYAIHDGIRDAMPSRRERIAVEMAKAMIPIAFNKADFSGDRPSRSKIWKEALLLADAGIAALDKEDDRGD